MSRTRWGYTRKGEQKTPDYYRSGLTRDDFRLAMSGKGWLSATQIVGLVSHLIPPEAKARYAELRRCTATSMDDRLQSGCRELVSKRMRTIICRKDIEKKGIGRDAKYRWVEKDNKPRQDTA